MLLKRDAGFLVLEGCVCYRALDDRYIENTIDFATRHLLEHECLISKTDLDYTTFRWFVQLYCQAALRHGLSVIALDADSGEVIGFAINEDPYSAIAVDENIFYEVSLSFHPILDIVSLFKSGLDVISTQLQATFHLHLLGVKLCWQGNGIATRPIELSEEIAKKNGFHSMVTIATNWHLRKGYEKLEYKIIENALCKGFVVDGEKPFSHIVDGGVYLLSKKL
ncbi:MULTISPECIES: hypothetical protein [Cysteiniphilum]|uniref:hypothetical protein n=1 Tax=Cysteiniphilum TaxID=2056696 RepID=UPI001786A4F1|nr:MULTISPECIES: hypothetical protein [Cysteiniphilum]